MHVPAVDSDREAQRDGDWLERAARQRRRAEFAEILRRIWTSDRPIDFAGEFYTIAPNWTPIRPNAPITVHASGASGVADEFGATYADTYFLPSLPAHELATRVAAASAHAARAGRDVRFGLRLRPVLAATRLQAQEYAQRVARVHRTSFDSPTRGLRRGDGRSRRCRLPRRYPSGRGGGAGFLPRARHQCSAVGRAGTCSPTLRCTPN